MDTSNRHLRLISSAGLVLVAALGSGAGAEQPPGVAVAAEVVEARKVDWDEVANRCTGSRPGGRIAPGYFVTLTLEGETYQFFLNGEQAQMCGSKRQPADPAGLADQGLRALADEARTDLASRLRVSVDQIRIRTAERVIWRDSSVGCPRSGQVYSQMLTEGARVVLLVGARAYSYHQAAGAPIFLCEAPSGLEPLPAHELE